MGKYSNYVKRPRDAYFTPYEAVTPLFFHLPRGFTFLEPCAGNGQLTDALVHYFEATPLLELDIEPQDKRITQGDATALIDSGQDYIITNPPFSWEMLVPLMHRFMNIGQTVLLLPADYMHNIRFSPFMSYCNKVVSIGRVKWIEGSKTTGRENYCWYFFSPYYAGKQMTIFIGRE